MIEEKQILLLIISNMEVPEQRLNLENEENVLWLKINLGIKNSNHRHFSQAQSIIKTLLNNEN